MKLTHNKTNMTNENKTITLTTRQLECIYNAIISTQNLLADKRCGNEAFDENLTTRIEELESILHKIITSPFDK